MLMSSLKLTHGNEHKLKINPSFIQLKNIREKEHHKKNLHHFPSNL